MSSEAKTTAANLNTILLAATLGVLSWVGYTVQQTAVSVAVIGTTSATHERELINLRARVATVEIEIARLRRGP